MKTKFLFFLFLTSSVWSTRATIFYFSETGHWYEPVLVTNGIEWADANVAATNRGGYLCTITNADENNFAASLVDSNYYSSVSIAGDILGPWLGGFHNTADPNWHWVTGEPFNFSNWYPGQPDGYGGNEQRLQFYNNSQTGTTWGDAPNGAISPGYSLPRGYIVEYNAPPLTVTFRSNILMVALPELPDGWTLETTSSLSSPAWISISPAQYQTNFGGAFISITNPVGTAFFRLRSN
jgi:hypothetical protein